MPRDGAVVDGVTDLAPAAPSDESEARFLARVRRLARANGFSTYHTHRSDHSEPGFPDLVLVRPQTSTRPGRVIFAELKAQRGKLSQDQTAWLSLLRVSIAGIEVYCWRSSDWERIVALLA